MVFKFSFSQVLFGSFCAVPWVKLTIVHIADYCMLPSQAIAGKVAYVLVQETLHAMVREFGV